MKRSLYLLSIFLFLGIFGVQFTVSQAHARGLARPKKDACTNVKNQLAACKEDLNSCKYDLSVVSGNLNTCNTSHAACSANLNTCNEGQAVCSEDLNACNEDLAECGAQPAMICPGDGYSDPDAYGVSGHGPALSYSDNGDGTFTDINTGLKWEIKDDAGGIHDKDNAYTWTDTGNGDSTDPDGTLFNVFLNALNNTCNGDGIDPCSSDADCTGIGDEVCGLAGHRDWRVPNAKELQSIVDYSIANPASSVPGLTAPLEYWSATTDATPGLGGQKVGAFYVHFRTGAVIDINKFNSYRGRAVRP